MQYDAYQKGPYKIAGYHDPDSKRLMGVQFRPPQWTANTVFCKVDSDSSDLVMPTVFTGLYYKVKNPGRSSSIEPTWTMVAGGETIDGDLGLVWEAVNYNLLPIEETIVSATYTCTGGVTVSSSSMDGASCQFMIDKLPPGLSTFQITCHVVKSNAEEADITFQFTVGER